MDVHKPIAIMVHDLNSWNEQNRSMLEIAWQLNQEFPLEIHSFSLEGYEKWPAMEHIQYQAKFNKPLFLKNLNYHFKSWQKLKFHPNTLIQSTGTASMKSSVVQVQFIHHAWQKILRRLPPDKIKSSSILKNSYISFLNLYKTELERFIYRPEKKYIAISHVIKKELMEYFEIPEENIEVIYHGVDPKYFHPWENNPRATQIRQQTRHQLGFSERDLVLLHVGPLNARKGFYKNLEVLSFIKNNGIENVKLLAVGSGDSKKIRETSEALGVDDLLVVAPTDKDIRRYYWSADAFFFPTFYEPFGLVILEAMASGLPVITSEIAGASELINESENGLLFDPWASPSEIANCILPLLRDPTLGKMLALRGRQTAEIHNWHHVGSQYRRFYKNILSSKSIRR